MQHAFRTTDMAAKGALILGVTGWLRPAMARAGIAGDQYFTWHN
ncbi:MAG: hypothetical protein ACJAYX_004982 [Planctomycetota bacterium]|jgi:hypothetical protein